MDRNDEAAPVPTEISPSAIRLPSTVGVVIDLKKFGMVGGSPVDDE